jgi:hypothetical protein
VGIVGDAVSRSAQRIPGVASLALRASPANHLRSTGGRRTGTGPPLHRWSG